MHGLVDRLARIHSLEVVERADASTLVLNKAGGFVFEITVPAGVLEWFVSAKDSQGVELWSDWADYYSVKSETRAELQSEMASDIERFTAILATSGVRKTSVLQWKHADVWCAIDICASPRCTKKHRSTLR